MKYGLPTTTIEPFLNVNETDRYDGDKVDNFMIDNFETNLYVKLRGFLITSWDNLKQFRLINLMTLFQIQTWQLIKCLYVKIFE